MVGTVVGVTVSTVLDMAPVMVAVPGTVAVAVVVLGAMLVVTVVTSADAAEPG